MIYRVGRDLLFRHPWLMSGPLGRLASWVPPGLRYGKEFRRTRALLERSQHWSPERHAAHQLEKLRETVAFAYHEIPFYRRRFDAAGAHPDQLRSLDDIRRFPSLGKEELKQHLEEIRRPGLDTADLMPFVTGGTSGSGTILHFEEAFRQREQAFIWRLWSGAGYSHGTPAAILQHRDVPETENEGLWYRDHVSRALILSSHRMTRDNVASYLEAFDAFGPKAVVGYPSLLFLFATYARERGWKAEGIDVVICTSETLYDFQRRLFEEVFQAPVKIHYGMIESCALFGYCRNPGSYHVFLEYGLTEFLREDGEPTDPGEAGEIVATSFDNFSIPLIRYHTGDWATLSVPPYDCGCPGAHPRVESIQGRTGDFLIGPSGKAHSAIVIEVLMDDLLKEGIDGFADLQIRQQTLERVEVSVQPGATFAPFHLERFCEELAQRLDGEIEVDGRLVDHIPRTSRQKKSLIVSEIADRRIHGSDETIASGQDQPADPSDLVE